MKRLFSLLLCLMLLTPACVSAQEPVPDHAAVCDEWSSLLNTLETICMTQDWALTQAEKYLETSSWSDLLLARLAASSAASYLTYAVSAPEATIPAAAYAALLMEGQDLTFIPTEFSAIEATRQSAVNTMQSLLEQLHFGVFWKYDDEVLRAWVKNERETLRIEMMLTGVMTNALAAAPGSETVLLADKADFTAACPVIFGVYTEWSDDSAALEANYAALLDQLEARLTEDARILGMIEANYTLLESMLNKGDIAAFSADAVTISSLPLMLPDPSWTLSGYPMVDYQWYEEETGEMYYMQPGEPLKPCTVVMTVAWYGVTREDFDTYITSLTDLGLPFAKDKSDDEGRTLYFVDGSHAFVLDWSPKYAMLYATDSAICQAPLWYILAAHAKDTP